MPPALSAPGAGHRRRDCHIPVHLVIRCRSEATGTYTQMLASTNTGGMSERALANHAKAATSSGNASHSRKLLAHLEKAAGYEYWPELASLAGRAPPAQPRLI